MKTSEIIQLLGSCSGAVLSIIALITTFVKPLRSKFVGWIFKLTNRKELDSKIDTLTNLVEKQVEQINNMNNELQKQSMALQASLRNSILNIYNESTKKGSITMYEKENLAKLFEQYKDLGGNSFIHECWQELNALPVRND